MRSEEDIAKGFQEGFDCAMATLMEVADDIGMTEDQAKRTASCFGIGMLQGSLCGAVTAGFIAIGCKYGNTVPNDRAQKGLVMAKKEEFLSMFTEEFGELTCQGLLDGLDLRKPEDMAKGRERGVFSTFCPKLCKRSAEMIKTVI